MSVLRICPLDCQRCFLRPVQHFAVRLSQGKTPRHIMWAVVISNFNHRLHPLCLLVFVHKYVVTTHMHDNTNLWLKLIQIWPPQDVSWRFPSDNLTAKRCTCTERSPRHSNEVWTVLRHQYLPATYHKNHRPIKTNERYIVFMLSQWTSTRRLVPLSNSPRTCTYTAHHPRRSSKVWTVLRHRGLSATCHKCHKLIKTSASYTLFVPSQWMTTSQWEIIWSRHACVHTNFSRP